MVKKSSRLASEMARALVDDLGRQVVWAEKEYGVTACNLKARAWTVPDNAMSTRSGSTGCELNIMVIPQKWDDRTYFFDGDELEKDFEGGNGSRRHASQDSIEKAREVLLDGIGKSLCMFVLATGIGISSVSVSTREWTNVLGDSLDERLCHVCVMFDLAGHGDDIRSGEEDDS